MHLKTLQHCARRTPARWAAWGRQPMVEEKCACAVESGHTYIDSAVLCAADPRALGSLEPTSPRSVEACLRLGIEPASLQFRPLETFQLSREAGDLASWHSTLMKLSARRALAPSAGCTCLGAPAVAVRLLSRKIKSGLQHRQVRVK